MTNTYFIIILSALILELVLNIISNVLNLRALKEEPPAELATIYEPQKYAASQQYTRESTRFGLVSTAFEILVLLGFWFLGGFGWLEQIVRPMAFDPVTTGLIYLGAILLAHGLLTLPFGIYATFVIEERFGFNRTTPKTFVMDRIKGLGVLLLLGVPLLAGVLALFEYQGDYAWAHCWIAVTLFSLVVQFIAPKWIMPLFNKFRPLEDGELKEAILRYARSTGYAVGNIFVIDGSKRSSKSNAFFTGFGRTKRIALFDTLIANHTTPELVAVLAHEIGHHKKRHILQGMVLGIVHSGIVFYLLSLMMGSSGLHQAFGISQPSVYTGLLFFGLLYTPVELLLSIGLQALSRHNEYQADRFAAETIDDPQAMVDTLKKLSADNLANLTPHPFYVFLNYSHPPLLERVRAIQAFAAQRSAR